MRSLLQNMRNVEGMYECKDRAESLFSVLRKITKYLMNNYLGLNNIPKKILVSRYAIVCPE